KREPRQMKLFEKADPGESIQVDVKYVQIAGRWAFQYTALDDCTRFRILRLYRRLHHRPRLAFLAELRRAFPFPLQRLTCYHGPETCRAPATTASRLGLSCPRVLDTQTRWSILTGPNRMLRNGRVL